MYPEHRDVTVRDMGRYKMLGGDGKTCLNVVSFLVIWAGGTFELSFLVSCYINFRYKKEICFN